jgi:hypothetical protein
MALPPLIPLKKKGNQRSSSLPFPRGGLGWGKTLAKTQVRNMTEPTKSLQSVLVFDGQDDCVNLGKKPEFKIEKEITLEAWIYCQNQRRRTGIVSNVFDTTATESGYQGRGKGERKKGERKKLFEIRIKVFPSFSPTRV